MFTSIGRQTVRKYGREELVTALEGLASEQVGTVLRAKGILPCTQGGWLHFDYTPGEIDLREGAADYTGRLCVIGAKLNEPAITALFHLS